MSLVPKAWKIDIISFLYKKKGRQGGPEKLETHHNRAKLRQALREDHTLPTISNRVL